MYHFVFISHPPSPHFLFPSVSLSYKAFFFLKGVYLLYSVVLVSAVQQNELALCTPMSPPAGASGPRPHPTRLGRHRAPSWALCGMAALGVVFQLLTPAWLFVTPWTAALQASLSFTISWSLLKLLSVESVMPSNHPLWSFPSPPALHLSQHWGIFSDESALCIR